ncbi:sensor domain-containing diguanylate cyclase [Salinicola endophyticus]|uniref:diguanylate cyclase n=1 Tax=Salinicola endophyticus TaxID=1949083 RepID=A0ABY8FGE8_9GAMM|nr:diguanylate cyclase [Salinicola endophyticus]WFF40251.1 sensor domain-containing diguanylate cyclase [Salinicola endophyticus]
MRLLSNATPRCWRLVSRIVRQGLRHLLLVLAWLALWRLSALMEYAPHASLWFPPAGLSFAALIVLGWRALPSLLVSCLLATFWVDQLYVMHQSTQELLTAGLAFGLAHCSAYGLGAWALRSALHRQAEITTPTLVPLFLVTACLSALAATLTGILSLEMTGLLDWTELDSIWLPWWIGDMAGVIVLAPLFLAVLSWRYVAISAWLGGLDFQLPRRPSATFIGKLLLCLLLLSGVTLVDAKTHGPDVAFAVFFLIIPLMWIVYTESAFRSALSLALFALTTALWVAELSLVEQSMTYQFAICVIATSGYFGFAVPALAARNRQLSELAARDPLTGVFTRRAFFDKAEQMHAEARRSGRPLALLVLDMDHFKRINDDHGHDVGDQTLMLLCHAVMGRLAPHQLFGRFGGDEFLLLVNSDLDTARETSARLKHHIAGLRVPGTQHPLSATIGIAELRADDTLTLAFRRADLALLQAKRSRHRQADIPPTAANG